MSQQNYSPVNVYPSIPPATDIVAGSLDGSTGTLVTIPAGRTWCGSIYTGLTIASTPPSVQASGITLINVVGSGATPAAGTILEAVGTVASTTGAVTNDGLNTAASASLGRVWISASTANSVTLALAKSGTLSYITGSAFGILL